MNIPLLLLLALLKMIAALQRILRSDLRVLKVNETDRLSQLYLL